VSTSGSSAGIAEAQAAKPGPYTPTAQVPRVWFMDTSSLLTMAVHPDIEAAILAEMIDDRVVVIDIVADELAGCAKQSTTQLLATNALARMPAAWTPLETTKFVQLADVKRIQTDVADGRVLSDDHQHWAESVIIALCERSVKNQSSQQKMFLSEDYDARRVANTVAMLTALSIHRALYERVKGGRMTAADAAHLCAIVYQAQRGPEITADDFTKPISKGLKRVGMP
jgi:hypothetical protein